MTDYRISGIPASTFREMFAKSDEVLAAMGMKRCTADGKPGYPCRIELVDAEVGEALILGNYEHHPVKGPYRASGPVFVRENAANTYKGTNEIPFLLRRRLLSVRAYDRRGLMQDADVIHGQELESLIERFFDNEDVTYLHAHNARQGCFLCQIDRR